MYVCESYIYFTHTSNLFTVNSNTRFTFNIQGSPVNTIRAQHRLNFELPWRKIIIGTIISTAAEDLREGRAALFLWEEPLARALRSDDYSASDQPTCLLDRSLGWAIWIRFVGGGTRCLEVHVFKLGAVSAILKQQPQKTIHECSHLLPKSIVTVR